MTERLPACSTELRRALFNQSLEAAANQTIIVSRFMSGSFCVPGSESAFG